MMPNTRRGNKTPVRQSRYGTRTHSTRNVEESSLLPSQRPVIVGRLAGNVNTLGWKTELSNRFKKPQHSAMTDACHTVTRKARITFTPAGTPSSNGRPNNRNATIPRRQTAGMPVPAVTCRPRPSSTRPKLMTRNRRRHTTRLARTGHKHFDSSARFTTQEYHRRAAR